MPASFITRLALTQFRSYRWLELTPGPSSVALVGPNGIGKTNILEALSLLGPGRGLRKADPAALRQLNAAAPSWGVVGVLNQGSAVHELGTAREENAAGAERRVAQIDGSPAGLQALADFLPISWLTPDMDRVLGGDKTEKRRFFDRLVTSFDPAHAGRLTRYDKLARERLTLLTSGNNDDTWLSTLEEDMAGTAIAIAAARLALAGAVNQKAPSIAGQFPVVEITFADGPETWLMRDNALTVEDRLRNAYAVSRPRDRKSETTEVGAGRSDIQATYVAKNMPADLCSTGEQKAMLITLLLTHAALVAEVRGNAPILLLDEVASHLDSARRQALFVTLHALGCQVWMTGTEPELFRGFPGTLTTYQITAGGAKKVLFPEGENR